MRVVRRESLARWSLLFVGLNLLDALTTVCILHFGGIEQNPLIRRFLSQNVASFAEGALTIKAAVSVASVAFVYVARARAPRSVLRAFMTVTLALISVTAAWNFVVLFLLASR